MTADPSSPHVGIVVEGPGDRDSLPILLRTHLHSQAEYREILGKPIPCKGRGSATVPGGIEGYVATAAFRPGCRAVLVVLDGDDDKVCELGPRLAERIASITQIPTKIVLAEECYEDWLYASIETLKLGEREHIAGRRGIIEIKQAILAAHQSKYVKPVWQPRLTKLMDLEIARARSSSLNRLLVAIDQLRQGI